MTINVYAANRGWLFQDFKAAFSEAGAVASNEPLPDADAWIAIRTDELVKSPDLSRTVCQVHDVMAHRGLDEACELDMLGALAVTHEVQLNPKRRRVKGICQPIGARRCFTLRESMPDRFTVGWVGRPFVYQGRDLKRFSLFLKAAQKANAAAGRLPGDRLGSPAQRYCPENPDATQTPSPQELEAFYHSIDFLITTSESPNVPLPVWEALACGVPVISTPRDITHRFILQSDEHTAEDLAGVIKACALNRGHYFERRAEIRASLEWWMDDWIAANMGLARNIA